MLPPDVPLLLLASTSPARAKLLADSGMAFEQLGSEVDEDAVVARAGLSGSAEIAAALARAKCEAVAALPHAQGRLVIGCDSVFELDGRALGKPHTPEVARERLREMRGRTGYLHTGHWLIDTRDAEQGGMGLAIGRSAGARVSIAELSETEVEAYIATGEPLQVAGSFTLDGYGAAFIDRVDGDLHAVIGLSLNVLRRLAAETGVPVQRLWGRA